MEWRIILPVVCVLGILFGPGSTAQDSSASTKGTVTNATATNATATNASVTNATATNATVTNASVTNATATNVTVTNASVTNATVTHATATNATGTNATVTNASVTNATATNATVTNASVTNATATNATVTNASVTNATATNATATHATATNATATATHATVTNATATNATATNATATNASVTNATATNATVTHATATNATATNASLTNATATNATATHATGTNVTTTNATATNMTSTNAPAPNGMTMNPTTSAVTKLDITYSINQIFKNEYTNLSHPETIILKDKITPEIELLYKKRFTNFRRYVIRRFRNGSIVTDGDLEFNASNSNPNVSELAQVLVDAVRAGNLTFQIKNDSINVTVPATTVTPPASVPQINVTFSIKNNFTEALSNMSSPDAISLTKNITTEFVTVFKKSFANILQMVIRKFRNGSIVTEGALEFNGGTVPKAQQVVDLIVKEVKAGSFSFPVDEKSITATDSLGSATSHGSSPVISSMFTVLCMALASLLLSGVMHQ